MSQSDKQADLDALNGAVGNNLDANAMSDQLHEAILAMFDDYAIFGNNMRLISPMIKDRLWTTVAQLQVSKI